jgi:hypothetical protein
VSGLVFRIDEREHVLRSVGDPPNGVVGVVDFFIGEPPADHPLDDGERFGVVVDPNVQAPPGAPTDGGVIVLGKFENATPISYDDALRACPDPRTANQLCSMIVECACTGFGIGAGRLDPDYCRAAAASIERLRETVIRSVHEGWGPGHRTDDDQPGGPDA